MGLNREKTLTLYSKKENDMEPKEHTQNSELIEYLEKEKAEKEKKKRVANIAAVILLSPWILIFIGWLFAVITS